MTKKSAPSANRNKEYILQVLRDVLPDSGTVLEIASGSGEHGLFFAAEMPHLIWQPSDRDAEAHASIAAWKEEQGTPNLQDPLALDVCAGDWPLAQADAVVCINMVHISPWQSTEGLFAGAARIMPAAAPLYLYGPYKIDGAHTAPSNESFDQWLKQQNPDWGVRDLEDVKNVAEKNGFTFNDLTPMPANNFSVVFNKN